jgi:hypothetical protein
MRAPSAPGPNRTVDAGSVENVADAASIGFPLLPKLEFADDKNGWTDLFL